MDNFNHKLHNISHLLPIQEEQNCTRCHFIIIIYPKLPTPPHCPWKLPPLSLSTSVFPFPLEYYLPVASASTNTLKISSKSPFYALTVSTQLERYWVLLSLNHSVEHTSDPKGHPVKCQVNWVLELLLPAFSSGEYCYANCLGPRSLVN